MIGLLYLGFFAVYLWLSVLLTKWAVKKARSRDIAGWKFGLPMALVMYHLVFWDWIPTVVAHKYYCATEAGFTVYKTLEEWKAENPGVMETLVSSADDINLIASEITKYGRMSILNQRMGRIYDQKNISILPIQERSISIIDIQTGDTLVGDIDFQSGYGNMMTSIGWGAKKFWLNNSSCLPLEKRQVDRGLLKYTKSILSLGK